MAPIKGAVAVAPAAPALCGNSDSHAFRFAVTLDSACLILYS